MELPPERDDLSSSCILSCGTLDDSISHLMLLALITVHPITTVSVDNHNNSPTFPNVSTHSNQLSFHVDSLCYKCQCWSAVNNLFKV